MTRLGIRAVATAVALLATAAGGLAAAPGASAADIPTPTSATISPTTATIPFMGSQAYTTSVLDQSGNVIPGDVAGLTLFDSDGQRSTHGMCSQDFTCAPTLPGTYKVTAAYLFGKGDGVVAAATLTVLPPTDPATQIALSIGTPSVYAGESVPVGVTAYDAAGKNLGQYGQQSTFTITNGSCQLDPPDSASCLTTVTGTQTITATYNGLTASGTVQVTPAGLSLLSLSPPAATVTASASQAFGLTGVDYYGNAMDSLSPDAISATLADAQGTNVPGACTVAPGTSAAAYVVTCTPKIAGTYTVTAEYDNSPYSAATATLTATPAVTTPTVAFIRIRPTLQVAVQGVAFPVVVSSYDRRGRYLGDVSGQATLAFGSGRFGPYGACGQATCTAAVPGVLLLRATLGTLTSTAAIIVVPPLPPHRHRRDG